MLQEKTIQMPIMELFNLDYNDNSPFMFLYSYFMTFSGINKITENSKRGNSISGGEKSIIKPRTQCHKIFQKLIRHNSS